MPDDAGVLETRTVELKMRGEELRQEYEALRSWREMPYSSALMDRIAAAKSALIYEQDFEAAAEMREAEWELPRRMPRGWNSHKKPPQVNRHARRLGRRLAERRKQFGLTREELAKYADVTIGDILALERGETTAIRFRAAERIYEAMGWGIVGAFSQKMIERMNREEEIDD